MFIAILSLIGFPCLSGFYSKDLIVDVNFLHFAVSSSLAAYFSYVSLKVGTALSTFYSIRLLFLIGFNKYAMGYRQRFAHIKAK